MSSDGTCYRTLAAARSLKMSPRGWDKFIQGHEDDSRREKEDRKAVGIIRDEVLEPCIRAAVHALDSLAGASGTSYNIPQAMLEIAKQRWEQIRILAEEACTSPMSV